MTWTYNNAPSTATASGRLDAVRMLIGDTDTNDQQLTDEEINFALSEANDDIYLAAAISARSLVGKYSRLVDTSFEGMRSAYQQRAERYQLLAQNMEEESKKRGGQGLGGIEIGGVSIDQMDAVDDLDDRVTPAFRKNQFRNPPDLDSREENTQK